uniref:LRAT domain-containing protein n=1 Tax=Cynoglossus semilaevis TaxID=244447 RepID=A0A3P8UIE9_CYNSE
MGGLFSGCLFLLTPSSPSSVSSLFGDLIEFANPWLGLSLWAVYAGEGQVIHFGVGGIVCRGNFPSLDENMTQKACLCIQRITELKLPAGTRIRVNNNKHNLAPSQPEWMKYRCDTLLQQEFKYDLLSFNSEHFATFIRYGQAVCNQVSQEPNVFLPLGVLGILPKLENVRLGLISYP